jgi:hypothetical protein
MKIEPIKINYEHSQLLAIPSVHFSHVFAFCVNKICSCTDTHPDAIAVELGPQTAAAVQNWLKELGVMPDKKQKLPVMLGLAKKNRVIHPSFKEKVLRLQKNTGKDLSELPLDLLYQELGFAGNSLVCMAPTDSIIEAIRCSLELDVPLYGIDLEESANGGHEKTTIEDPIGANGNLIDYIDRNAHYAARQRDNEIDVRREMAMVARLKTILKQHQRVLFACGMAHWPSIREMLHDSSIRPSSKVCMPSDDALRMYKRIVLHPVKAIPYMDLFPAVVKEYEKHRKSPSCFDGHPIKGTYLDPKRLFDDLMQETYEEYFANPANQGLYRHQDLESVDDFERYLLNLCFLNLRAVPDFFTTLSSAQEMMSSEFVQAITRKFMDFPWTSLDEHPGCSLLAPDSDDDGTYESVVLEDNEMPGGKSHFYIRTVPGQVMAHTQAKIPYEWKNEKIRMRKVRKLWGDGILHTWIPWEYLITSMSLRAINKVRRRGAVDRVEPFEGSLLDGIDVKATLRSHSRGKNKLYVRDTVKEPLNDISNTIEGFPVVWILTPHTKEGNEWIALYEYCEWMKKHVRDRSMLDQVRNLKGGMMIALIGYGNRYEHSKASKLNSKIRSDHYDGIIMYQPICWSKKQFARWVEVTQFQRNPFCHHGVLGAKGGDLTRLFDEEHGVKIGEYDWTTTMVLLALPYARGIMAVVAPDGYAFDPIIRDRACRYGVDVCRVSLSLFSKQEIKDLSINHMAPAIIQEPRCLFHKSIEAAIGQKQTDNEHLVPRSCLEFGTM